MGARRRRHKPGSGSSGSACARSRCRFRRVRREGRDRLGRQPAPGSTPPATAYGPAQFPGGYALPTTGPNAEADLATYDSYYGLPACTTANGCFKKVSQTGSTTSLPATDAGWALEISLDVQTAHQICQNCKILLVEASSASMANLGAAVNEAVALGATTISNSYGGGESIL